MYAFIPHLKERVFPLENHNRRLHRMKAKIKNTKTGEVIDVTSTREHPECSYNEAIWADENGTPYCKIGFRNEYYEELQVGIDTENLADLGEYLRNLRVSAGISVRQMADLATLSPATVVNMEKGSFIPRLDVLSRYLNAAGSSISITRIKK